MIAINQVVDRIVTHRAEVPGGQSLLVGISGIDGSGKGYVTRQLEAHLGQRGIAAAVINADGWLNLPDARFDPNAPAEHFYQNAIRFDQFYSDLVVPLRNQRHVHLVADFAEERARQYRKHVYDFKDVSVVLVEGIFLFKHQYRSLFDLTIWIDCSFPTALARALDRRQEGLSPAKTIAAYETIYFPAQMIHFERDNPSGFADLILNNDHLCPKKARYATLH